MTGGLLLSVSAILCALLVCGVGGEDFEVQVGYERCFKEEFRVDTLVKGEASIQPEGQGQQCHFRVLDPRGSSVYETRDLTKANFAFTADSEAAYSFCFRDSGATAPTPRLGSLKLKTGEAGPDYSEIAKRENLKPLEVDLRKLEDNVNKLRTDFSYMKKREMKHRDTNESTNNRVMWMSVLSFGILIGVGLWQVYYLKRYFKSKKLI